MKATKYLSLAALALMGTLASCQSDDEAAASFARPDNAVGINVTVGSLKGTTRSNAIATDDTQREFNLGDQVCVSTDGQDPVLFQCTNADQQTWAEAEAGKFLLWTQNEMTFKAYYPATDGTSMTAFTLPADQSSEAKIALADYMTRQQTRDNESGNDITLNLERKTARVIVRIAGFTDQYFDDQKTVDNVRIYSEASGIADGNPTGSSTEIQPYAQGSNDGWGWSQNSTFTALVVPGYGDDGATFIQLTDGEGSTLLVKGIPELEAGYSYTFNLVVGKNRIEVASVTVQDWATGEPLSGGQAEEGSASASTPLDNTTTAWTAGTFAVPAGGLTYSDAITVNGDVTLVLTDGETLTLNKGISLASGATLTIQGNGAMVVNGTNNSTASTVAGSTGTLVLTSGTLTATGGNGQDATDSDETGASGGVAINGSVTVNGGSLTANGGNGGNCIGATIGPDTYAGAGGAAISGDVTITDGAVAATGGNGGSIGASNYGFAVHGGAGGAAIGGNATLTGGTLTTTQGANGTGSLSASSVGTGGKAVAGTVTNNGGTVN